MEQPITIRYRWTADELLTASRCHSRQSGHRLFRFGVFLAVAILLIAIFIKKDLGVVDALGIAIGIGMCWFVSRSFTRWQLGRQFHRRPDRNQEQDWRVYPDRLVCQSGLGQSEFKWEALAKVVRSPKGYLLYPNERIFFWLPRHGFQSDVEFQRMAELSKGRVKKYANVG